MPRLAPKRDLTVRQRSASWAGWAGVAVLMATLLYWLYLTGIEQNRNGIANTGLIAGTLLILYFLFGMGSVILANFRSPEGKRSIQSFVLIVAIIGIICVGNVLAYRRHYQWDLTGNRRLSLSPMTVRLLQHLDKKISVTAFYSSSAQRRFEQQEAQQVRDLLDQYADRSSNFTYQMVDYRRDLAKWQNMAMSIRLTSDPPVTVFTTPDGGKEEVKGTTEKDFTAALIKLTRKQKKHIYFTEGHGELDPTGMNRQNSATVVKQVLTDQQDEVATVNLSGKERKVPADCSVLVIAGPDVEFQPEEIKAVNDYLNNGGKALVLLRIAGPSLAGLLKEWGLKAGDNYIVQLVDFGGGLMGISRSVAISKFETHDVNRGLTRVVFPAARSIDSITPAPAGLTVTPILRSTADSVAKPLPRGSTRIDPTPKPTDPKGPFTLAAVAEKSGGKKPRLLVIGSSDFAMDLLADNPENSDRYLFTNAVNWLAEEDALVDIPPKDTPPDTVTLTPQQRLQTLFLNLLLMPTFCLFMAVFVWWKRR